jgi:hypothetical protein
MNRKQRAAGAKVHNPQSRRPLKPDAAAAVMARMEDKPITYPDPSEVTAVDGAVQLDGPDSVDVAMTPEAAEETSARLENEAVRARGQRRLKDLPHQPNH